VPAVLIAGLAIVVAAPLVFYEEYFQPREYMKGWGADMGVPPGMYSVTTDRLHARSYELTFAADCGKGCHEDVMGDAYTWMNRHGFALSKADLDRCFSAGCVRWARHDGHRMRLWVEQTVWSRYRYDVSLYY
jgi:hypothetical protein